MNKQKKPLGNSVTWVALASFVLGGQMVLCADVDLFPQLKGLMSDSAWLVLALAMACVAGGHMGRVSAKSTGMSEKIQRLEKEIEQLKQRQSDKEKQR